MNILKNLKFYVTMFFIIVFGIIGYKTITFTLFDDPITLLKEYEILNKNFKLRIYSIPSNATMNSSIQIRKFNNKTEKVLFNYDRFNRMNSSTLINDTLMLEISDTNHINSKKTICIRIDSLSL